MHAEITNSLGKHVLCTSPYTQPQKPCTEHQVHGPAGQSRETRRHRADSTLRQSGKASRGDGDEVGRSHSQSVLKLGFELRESSSTKLTKLFSFLTASVSLQALSFSLLPHIAVTSMGLSQKTTTHNASPMNQNCWSHFLFPSSPISTLTQLLPSCLAHSRC